MADLIINGRNALQVWGIRMGDKFLDVLGSSSPMKEFIENKSRLEHGKRVIVANPKLDSREITLAFTIEGETPSDFNDKKKLFYDELYKGEITIQVPKNGNDVYRLIYLGKSATYGQSLDRTFGKISAKFCECNPALRT